MFFNLVLLNPQHRGRFGFAWISATRGVRYINKKDILELDISKLCDDIINFVCSESDSPRSRFSLRLSSILINGTIKIQRQKAVFFLDDLFKFMSAITTPPVLRPLETTGLYLTPPTPILKVKGKKRRRVIEESTPESQLEQIVANIARQEGKQDEPAPSLGIEPIVQARVDEVTLRETQLQPQEQLQVGDLGVLGTFEPIEEDLERELRELGGPVLPPLLEERPEQIERLLAEEPTPMVQPPPQPMVVEELAQKLTSSSSSEPGLPVTVTVEAQVHVSAELRPLTEVPKQVRRRKSKPSPPEIVDVGREQPPPPPEEPMEIEVPPPRPVLAEMQADALADRDRQVRKKVDDLEKLLVITRPVRAVRINRCGPDELELVDVSVCPLSEFKIRNPVLTNLINTYLIRDGIDLQQRRKPSEVSSLQDSATLPRKSGQLTPVEVSQEETTVRHVPPLPPRLTRLSVPEIHVIAEAPQEPTDLQVPLMASTPVSRQQMEVSEIEQRTIEQTMAVAAEERITSPRKKRRLNIEFRLIISRI